MKVQFVSETGAKNFESMEAFVAAAASLALTPNGFVSDTTNAGLQGLPKFAELAGPMGPQKDGTEVRYETWKAYEMYSS